MKYLTFICLLYCLLSCKSKNKVSADTTSSISNEKLYIPTYAVNKFEGTYSGNFDQGFITINLNYINGKNVSGYNSHRGTRRNINGMLQPDANGFKFILKEPGDNPYDGTFEFTIDTTKFALTGLWTPFDTSKTKAKRLALVKQQKKEYNDSIDFYIGTWVPDSGTYSSDTTLALSNEGECIYSFYKSPGDSTSQLNTVKGNYVISKDTVLIEWQKNPFTPSQKMKLVKRNKKIKGEEYEVVQLAGNGWKLVKLEGE